MLALLLLLVSNAPGPEPASSKGYLALADQVDHSSLVCIGTVEDIVLVLDPESGQRSLPVARVAVERVLKGAADTRVVHHEAWGTWMCDSTGAHVGQRALLFLREGGEVARFPEEVRREVYASLGTEVVLRNVGSGDGIRTLGGSIGDERVSCSAPDAVGPRTKDGFRLSDVVRYVEELVRFAPEALRVHARSGQASSARAREPGGSFDLRVLSDGSVRLARGLGRAEHVVTWQLEPDEWAALARELALATAGEVRTVGVPEASSRERLLTLRSGEAALHFVQPRNGWSPPLDGTPAERLALVDALNAWSTVLAAIDCEGCDDHSENDRRWFAALR